MASSTFICVVGLALVGVTWAQLMGLSQPSAAGPLASGGGMNNVPYGGSTQNQMGSGGGGGGMQYGNMQQPNNMFSNPWSGYMWGRFLDVNPLYTMMMGGFPNNGQGNTQGQQQGGGGGGMFGGNSRL